MHFATLLVAAAVGVSAHPSGHNHRAFHAKKEAGTPSGKLITATINGKVVTWTEGAASPWKQDIKPEVKNVIAVATQSAKVEPAAATATKEPTKDDNKGNTSEGNGASTYEPFCGNGKRAAPAVDYSETSLDDIKAVGNTGKCGYGSNYKLIASEKAMEGYKFGVKVSGGSKKLKCGAYNKIASTGEVEGFFPKHFAKSFDVAAGGEQWIAVEDDTQGGIICTEKGDFPVNNIGLPTVTWAEYDFGSSRNNGWIGFDASGLTPADNHQACTAMKICAIKLPKGVSLPGDKVCSSINAGMACDGTNAYTAGLNNKGGLGSNLMGPPKGESVFLHVDYS